MLDPLTAPDAPATGAPMQPQETGAADATTPEQLAELPPIAAVLQGKPAAVYSDLSKPGPGVQLIAENMKGFGTLGLQLFRGKDSVVLFNPKILAPDALKQADEKGQISTVAAPLDQLLAAGASAQAQAPAASPAPAQDAATAPPIAMAPAAAPITPRTQAKLAGSRIASLSDDQPPSQRPVPGAGRTLNSLLQRAA